MIGGGARRLLLTAGVVLAAAAASGCAPSAEEVEFLAARARLERQNQGIRELIAEAEKGTLVPADRFLVGIDEKVVAGLLESQLPIERPLGKRFVVRLERATVLLRDKFGLITIEGNIHRPQTPERRTTVRVHGGLGAVRVDPETDILTIEIAIDRIEVLQAGLLDQVLGPGGKKLLGEKGRDMMQGALPTLHVPVTLAQKVQVPAIEEGPIQLDSLAIPLDLSVERVLAAGGKLWLTLQADVGRVTGAEGGIGVSVKKKPKKSASAAPTKEKPVPPDSAGGGA